jgi:three-Cys-motif partner protein
MDDILWPLEPATAAKHRLYQHYLDGYWPVMLQRNPAGWRWPLLTYVDAFAGPGRYEDGEPGSPVFVLERLLSHNSRARMGLSPDRVRLVFIEKHRGRYEHLARELAGRFGDLAALPVRVELVHGEAAVETEQALDRLGAWGNPILGIFDSWGNVNVPLTLLERIAASRGSEAIVTFGPNWFSRREDLNAGELDSVFGGRRYWQKANAEDTPDERWRAWLSTYRDALARAGFEFQLKFEVVPRTGQPLFLVHGTKHIKGVKVMKTAMWDVDKEGGLSFRDPRTRNAEIPGQMDMFSLSSGSGGLDLELRELIVQRLAAGETTVAQLRDWLERETARWLGKHANAALTLMREEDSVVVEPHGQITMRSAVRLPSTRTSASHPMSGHPAPVRRPSGSGHPTA